MELDYKKTKSQEVNYYTHILQIALFENEKGVKETLITGDYVNIEPMVKHWVEGILESQLILIK